MRTLRRVSFNVRSWPEAVGPLRGALIREADFATEPGYDPETDVRANRPMDPAIEVVSAEYFSTIKLQRS